MKPQLGMQRGQWAAVKAIRIERLIELGLSLDDAAKIASWDSDSYALAYYMLGRKR